VFLHGFMGNVTLQCWEIAQAARPLGMLTVCPSTGWIGDWWRPGGAATVQATLDFVRARGGERIYVGGFSNGGIGLSRLAESVAAEDGVKGLFFIAGVTNADGIAATGLPVLIVAGTQDERMGTSGSAAAAGVIGVAARYVQVEGDHFLIVKEAEAVREALGDWLEAMMR
jgi:pimeloyl-ACP methyl ester carboxylesterase